MKFDPIPPNFYKVVWHRGKQYSTGRWGKFRYYPYDAKTKELKPEYWTLPRTTDWEDYLSSS